MSFDVRLLVGSLRPTAGSHIYNRELIRRLAERGHRVSVVAFDDGGTDWGDVELHVLREGPWQRLPVLWRWASRFRTFDFRWRLPSLKLSRPDVVIGTEHLLLKPHLACFPGVPWLYLPHSNVAAIEIESYGLHGLHRRCAVRVYHQLQQWALKNASHVVRFNQHSCHSLLNYHGEDSVDAEFFVNPQGVDLPDMPRSPRVWPSSDPVHLLFVGRLVPSKNLPFVLESLAQETQRNWVLDVVGDGSDRTACEDLSQRLGLQDRVRFHGQQSNVSEWYRRADLLVFPTKLECAPLVLIEALAHGLPSLVIREHGEHYRVPFAETIDGTNGLLADDEQHFRQLLAGVLRDPQQLEELSSNAIRYARERFSWELHLDRYEQAFRELVTGAAGLHPARRHREVQASPVGV